MSETQNIPYETINNTGNDNFLIINGEKINYSVLNSSNLTNDALSIRVENPANQHEVKQALTDRLVREYWFLSSEYSQGLKQRFRIQFDDTHGVDLYNFQDDDLKQGDLATIANSCALLYGSLRDKNNWKLESIQINKNGDVPNGKVKDDPSMGMEVYGQNRFILYPEAFDNENYFQIENCNWLKGITLHEGAHINLEQVLSPLWEENKGELGWTDVDDIKIQLPGGVLVSQYNKEPLRCPTEYGQYTQDDDRADSVVRYLVDFPNLDPVRANILYEELMSAESTSLPHITSVSAELPTCPPLNIRLGEQSNTSMRIGTIRKGSPKPVIDLDTFRQEHGIAS